MISRRRNGEIRFRGVPPHIGVRHYNELRAPAGATRKVLGWNVVDQVLPLPYTIGSAQLEDDSWISTMRGLDGTSDSAVTIRRHSTLRAGGDIRLGIKAYSRSGN